MYTDEDLFAFRVNIIRRMLENIMPVKDSPERKNDTDKSPGVKEINGSEMPPKKKKERLKTKRRKFHIEDEEETIDPTLQDSDTEQPPIQETVKTTETLIEELFSDVPPLQTSPKPRGSPVFSPQSSPKSPDRATQKSPFVSSPAHVSRKEERGPGKHIKSPHKLSFRTKSPLKTNLPMTFKFKYTKKLEQSSTKKREKITKEPVQESEEKEV